MMRNTLAALMVATSLGTSLMAIPSGPAAAITVFDPSNYAQNVAQAARALEQINNQIAALQNQAVVLQNMARNLERLDFSSLGQIMGALNRIDGLMIQAEGLSFELTRFEDQWREQYPDSFDDTLTRSGLAAAARERWQGAMAAFRLSMRAQAQIIANVRDDEQLLTELVTRSQSAAGALQVGQAMNQLIALTAKQQMQIQTLMAAQYRAEAQEAARKAQAEEEARQATERFLGSGEAYSGK